MNKLLSALVAAFVACAAIPVQAASHAGGAPMKPADKPAAAASAASDKKMDKKEAKKAEKKMEKKVPADKADAKK